MSKLGEGDIVTEQDAQALAERLTWVWRLDVGELTWWLDTIWEKYGFESSFIFEGKLVEGVYFRHFEESNAFRIYSVQLNTMIDCSCDIIRISQARIGKSVRELCPQFVTQWLPIFRRCCWLSGCDIEASTHEKAEWMQGFTKEELEAWNLKM